MWLLVHEGGLCVGGDEGAEEVKVDDRSVRNSVLGCDRNKDQEPE